MDVDSPCLVPEVLLRGALEALALMLQVTFIIELVDCYY